MDGKDEALLTGQDNTEPVDGAKDGPVPESQDDVLLTGEEAKAEAPAAPEAPAEGETYEFKMPEGVTLDPQDQENFVGFLKESKISTVHGQKLLEMAAAHVNKTLEGHMQEWRRQQNEWKESLKADQEFGGPKLPGTVKEANRVLSRFGDPEFIKELSGTGFANNAGLVKMLARISKVVSEDRAVEGGPAGAQPRTPGQVMYPTMKPTR